MKSNDILANINIPTGLQAGFYEGYVLQETPEVNDGDAVFANHDSVSSLVTESRVKSVA